MVCINLLIAILNRFFVSTAPSVGGGAACTPTILTRDGSTFIISCILMPKLAIIRSRQIAILLSPSVKI